MAFPTNPNDGQIYNKKIYNGTTLGWEDYITLPKEKPSNANLLAHYTGTGSGVGGAVATYHLDGNALDTSGNGNHMPNEYWSYIDGVSNNGIGASFSTVILPIKRTPAFTWALWTRWTGINNSYFYPTVLTDVSSHTYVGINHSGYGSIIYGEYGTASSNYADHLGLEHFDLSDLQWHFFVMTYDGIDQIKVYDNGKFRDSATNVLNPDLTHDLKLSLSAHNDQNEYDEINIFDRALSADEVLTLYNNPSNKNLIEPKIPRDGLIGEWLLDRNSYDTSGYKNNGVDTDIIYSQGRKSNQAGEFNGTTSLVDLSSMAASIPDSFTMCIWAKASGTPLEDYGQLFTLFDSTNSRSFYIDTRQIATPYYLGVINDGTTPYTSHLVDPLDTDWHFFAMSIESDGYTCNYYTDGKLIDTKVLGVKWSSADISTFRIGSSAGGANFYGKLENARLYNRALTEQEILALSEKQYYIEDKSLTRIDGDILSPISFNRTSKGNGINFSGNYSGLNIGKVDISDEGTISLNFKCEGDTGKHQTILAQSDNAFGYAIYLNPTTGYMSVFGAGVDTIITTNYFDNIYHSLIMKWDADNVYVLIDGLLEYTNATPTNTLRNSDFIIGNRKDAGQAEEKKFIGEEYTNLVVDPTDLTTANWEASSGLASRTLLSDKINGNTLTQITGGTVGSHVRQTVSITSTTIMVSMIVRNVDSDITELVFYDTSIGDRRISTITWDTKNVSHVQDYTWLDANTIEIYMDNPGSLVTTNVNQIKIIPSNTTASKTINATAVQVVDNTTTMFPFVDGTHTVDIINKNFTMPDVFAVDMIVEPKFAYDTSISLIMVQWKIDTSNYLDLIYIQALDSFNVRYRYNGTNNVNLYSDQFDDGTNYINLNQRIRIIFFANTISGIQEDAKLIVIPLESGIIAEDTGWNGIPEIKSSTFPTLSIGNDSGIQQADSDIEYLNIYDWDGVKPTIADSSDADTYFADKLPLFNFNTKENYIEKEKIYQGYNFNGTISDVRLYDKMLSVKEIRTL